jgi:hypothetical protein
MPRMRNLKPDFFSDMELCELPPLVRLLFQGLWCWADPNGRLEDKPRQLKAQILPFDDITTDEVNTYLDMLARRRGERPGHIIRYRVGTRSFIQVVRFKEHQNPHPKERPTDCPPPPEVSNDQLTDPGISMVAVANHEKERAISNHGSTTAGPLTSNLPVSGQVAAEPHTSRVAFSFQPQLSTTVPGQQVAKPRVAEGLDEKFSAEFKKLRGVEYDWQHGDIPALRRLFEKYGPTESLRRWVIGLRRPAYPRCDTIRDLEKHWPSYAADPPMPAGKGQSPGPQPERRMLGGKPLTPAELRAQDEADKARGAS